VIKFCLIGAAGYVAERHMKAIKEVGGDLVAALDPHDSVGILDSYFPDCAFFTEFERFDRHCSKKEVKIDYVSICSPNYLHDAHIRFALRIGADAICEKPLVLNVHNLKSLKEFEEESNNRVWNILQCRLHPNVKVMDFPWSQHNWLLRHNVYVEYVTPRGKWYDYSWKSNVEKSGGLATNIGVHLFDLLSFAFGRLESAYVSRFNHREVVGRLYLKSAVVKYRLSTNQEIPKRIFRIDEQHEIDLTNGFNDLHTESYRQILDGKGFGIDDTLGAIEICEAIRGMMK